MLEWTLGFFGAAVAAALGGLAMIHSQDSWNFNVGVCLLVFAIVFLLASLIMERKFSFRRYIRRNLDWARRFLKETETALIEAEGENDRVKVFKDFGVRHNRWFSETNTVLKNSTNNHLHHFPSLEFRFKIRPKPKIYTKEDGDMVIENTQSPFDILEEEIGRLEEILKDENVSWLKRIKL